ncbi:DUF59 domain-containing protein [Rhizosphaericola mali]|nr:DUF59 domain-containing protein [Rhizosphaericola mali]
MLSLFKNWNKSKDDPKSKCSSQPKSKQDDGVSNKEVVMSEESMENKASEEIKNETQEPLDSLGEQIEDDILNNNGLTIRDKIELALHTVYDPEIPVNIMELGLVYKIEIKENNVIFVTMTLTAPGCPVAGDILLEVEDKIKAIEGVTEVHVQLTFEPQWTKDMMSEEAKLELGFL